MADLTKKTESELKAIGTPEALDELIRRLNELRAQVIREALPGAIAAALRQTRLYHRSVLTGRCGG